MLAVPLLVRQRGELADLGSGAAALALIAVSSVIQMASLAFWLPLEIYQMETLGHPTFVIALRFKNIAAFDLGQDGRLGIEHGRDDAGSVGLRPHHDLEFSAVLAAPGWSGASLGGKYGLRGLGRGARRAGRGAAATLERVDRFEECRSALMAARICRIEG